MAYYNVIEVILCIRIKTKLIISRNINNQFIYMLHKKVCFFYQKSFGAPSQVMGVKIATATIIHKHMVRVLFDRLYINPAINSMKTIAAPYRVAITHTRKITNG